MMYLNRFQMKKKQVWIGINWKPEQKKVEIEVMHCLTSQTTESKHKSANKLVVVMTLTKKVKGEEMEEAGLLLAAEDKRDQEPAGVHPLLVAGPHPPKEVN